MCLLYAYSQSRNLDTAIVLFTVVMNHVSLNALVTKYLT